MAGTLPLRPFLLLMALACVPAIHAGLVFAEEQISHVAQPAEESFRAQFSFTNKGDETVTIGDIRSTCGCTVPSLDQKTYAPGESGTITAVFTYGQRTGRQQKTIMVPTNFGTHHLQLTVDIPQKWKVEPRIQTWRLQGDPVSKTIAVQFDTIRPTAVRLKSFPEEAFRAESRWNAENNRFEVELTPLDLSTAGVHRAHIEVVHEEGTSDIPVYVRIY